MHAVAIRGRKGESAHAARRRSSRLVSAILTVIVALVMALTIAAPASAQYRYIREWSTSGYYTVCAESLTDHVEGGAIVTLHLGHQFYYGGTRVGERIYGINQGERWGWVDNGWFCEELPHL